MNYLRNLAMFVCVGLLMVPAASSAETKPAANNSETKAQAGPTNEAAAEEKARKFFTDLEVVDQNGNKLRFYSDVL
mgnify:CR=1 FL=1